MARRDCRQTGRDQEDREEGDIMIPDYHGAEAVQSARLEGARAGSRDRRDGRHSLVERADLAIEVALHRLRDGFRNRPPIDWRRLRPIHH